MSACAVIGTILIVISMLGTLLTTASPFWTVTVSTKIGLFYSCQQRSGRCDFVKKEKLDIGSIVLLALMGMASLLTVIGFLVTVSGMCRKRKKLLTFGGAFLVIAGLCDVTACGLYAGLHPNWVLFGFSFYVTLGAGILGVVGGCMTSCFVQYL